MTRRELVATIRERIKGLSEEQKREKAKRKGCPQTEQSDLWAGIFARSIAITACLNFYHEVRGGEHCDNVRPQHRHWYDREMDKLRRSFEIVRA